MWSEGKICVLGHVNFGKATTCPTSTRLIDLALILGSVRSPDGSAAPFFFGHKFSNFPDVDLIFSPAAPDKIQATCFVTCLVPSTEADGQPEQKKSVVHNAVFQRIVLAITHAMKTPALALQIRLDVKVPCCLALPMRHDASQLLKAQTQLGRAASEVNRL